MAKAGAIWRRNGLAPKMAEKYMKESGENLGVNNGVAPAWRSYIQRHGKGVAMWQRNVVVNVTVLGINMAACGGAAIMT